MTELATYRRTDWTVQYWPQIGSTNDAALAAGQQGAAEGLLVLADEQTAGRGRLARRWESPAGVGLLMSLLFRPPEPFAYAAARVTMLCGLALAEVVETVGGLAAALKWPNDLIVAEPGTWRKLAGTLSEIGLENGAPAFLVVGIGLNVAVPPADLPALAPHATSLLAETGRVVSRVALLDAFLARVEAGRAQLRQGVDLWPAWRARLAWLGQPVTVHTPTQAVAGVAEDVDATGALLVRLPDGRVQSFAVGDVSLRV
ncbi:MAG TPA: biotin--[acetyl-CoA-carboxylase] ligase [Anaerolineae bacterium]|nr:biotin--[acetyl-CoA-carboxylase] ligase [Anaerolineae bacterium]